MNSKLTRRQPRGLLRLFLRMPIALYRVRLGWLLGGRFLMLTHTGRKSGQPRQTVLEVVYHDSETGAYFVAAAWRGKADWFKNVQANPAVQVTAGTRTFPAAAAVMQADEAARIFLAYARRYPLAFRELSRMMLGETLQPNMEDCLRMTQSVPLVALTPKSLTS
ncbi:MAG: nitroreductase family deazaflavin-dependent oxidoreductase [Anaerolineales bacterium]